MSSHNRNFSLWIHRDQASVSDLWKRFVCGHEHATATCGGQRPTFGSRFSSATMCIPGTEFGSLGLAAGTFTNQLDHLANGEPAWIK
ncbi:hypothetical protein LEMLEM_LOCUS13196 [Lemmus lemmus]